VTFDPFGDFDSQGYLRNFLGFKDIQQVKALEHASFKANVDRSMTALAKIDFIEYKHVLKIHKTLFSAVYPWAGQDRSVTAPGINISKAGYNSMFAQSQYVRRVTEYALDQSRDYSITQE
jgi:cell filamentation protein